MRLYSPYLHWNLRTKEKEVFLTFDDGPTPGVTEDVLAILKEHNAKATFFCLGVNVEANVSLFNKVLDGGHEIGNHTFDHPDGWANSNERYITNVNRCEMVFGSKFFRPPYGKISHRQIRKLKHRFQIIMWTMLSGDFDGNLSPDEILKDLIKNTKKGNIVVFHDNQVAKHNVLAVLPKYLKFLTENGYQCNVLRPGKRWFGLIDPQK
jgi:peptidoglycan-N-acetylglucosamine deacetylase